MVRLGFGLAPHRTAFVTDAMAATGCPDGALPAGRVGSGRKSRMVPCAGGQWCDRRRRAGTFELGRVRGGPCCRACTSFRRRPRAVYASTWRRRQADCHVLHGPVRREGSIWLGGYPGSIRMRRRGQEIRSIGDDCPHSRSTSIFDNGTTAHDFATSSRPWASMPPCSPRSRMIRGREWTDVPQSSATHMARTHGVCRGRLWARDALPGAHHDVLLVGRGGS